MRDSSEQTQQPCSTRPGLPWFCEVHRGLLAPESLGLCRSFHFRPVGRAYKEAGTLTAALRATASLRSGTLLPSPRLGGRGHFVAGTGALVHAWWQYRLPVHHSQLLGACKHESFNIKHIPFLFATLPPHPQIVICYAEAVEQPSFLPHALCCCKVFLLLSWPMVSVLHLEEFVCGPSYCCTAHSLSCLKAPLCFY